jgi:cytochrome P450
MTTATTLPAVTWSSGAAGAPLPPRVPGLPVLGNALSLQNDPLTFLVDSYHQYGPIFRLKALNREFTVMAGSEANQFLARAGDEHFSSELLFGGFAEEMGTRVFMVAMDGEPHRRLRKLMRRGFSREAIGDHMDKVVALARAETARWSPGKLIPLLRRLQILVAAQLGVVTVGREPGEDFDDIARFLNTNMRATVLRTAPRLMLQTPWYKRSKARVAEVADAVLAWHQANPPVDRPADLVDDMLAARTDEGQPYDQATLRVWAVGPFFAGIDTVANTLTFMVYALVKHPDVLARVRAEAAALLAGPLDDARSLKEYPALYGLVLETLRRYPVAAFTPRMAVRPFTFAGHRVEVGTEVMVANGVTHMLPQHFPNPEVFDIDRYQPPRNEHRQPNVFAPYTLGAHTCLGAGMAEVEMLLTIATIAHTVDLELPPAHANPSIALAPLPSLGPGFRVRVKAGAR